MYEANLDDWAPDEWECGDRDEESWTKRYADRHARVTGHRVHEVH